MRKSKIKWWWGVLLLAGGLAIFLLSACGTEEIPTTTTPTGTTTSTSTTTTGAATTTGTAATTEAAEPEFPYGKVRAVGFRTSDNQVYPDKKVWLTLTKGYAASNNNQIVTSGLNSVGVGTYVYLEGKATDAEENEISAWSWEVIGPMEAVISVENADTRLPRFLASVEGKYEAKVTVTKKDGTKGESEFPVYAGSYIGGADCALCHSGSVMPDKVTAFKETGHATKFETTFGRYSKTSDYCIGCHTTGYNETDKANGFDDLARLSGWDPATQGSVGAWIKSENFTLSKFLELPAAKLANVQCESCHGPGSVHTKALSYEPGVCSQCHPQEAQWRFSGHAKTGSANLHTAEGSSCVECHTGQGFVAVKIRGLKPVFAFQGTAENPATLPDPGAMAPVACATCHDPHVATEPFDKGTAEAPNLASLQLRLEGKVKMPNGVTVEASESAVCVTCHANKRDLVYKSDYVAGKKSRGAHGNTQADVLYATTASVFDFGKGEYATSPHKALVEKGCIQCHMAESPAAPEGAKVDGIEVVSSHGVNVVNSAGGHSWRMTGTVAEQEVENTAGCMTAGCHAEGSITTFNRKAYGDYDGDGTIEGIQDEVGGLLKIVADKLPKTAEGAIPESGIDKMTLTEVQRQALWNYSVINSEGSLGVHNTAFAVEVLQRTYKELTGEDVPGATKR